MESCTCRCRGCPPTMARWPAPPPTWWMVGALGLYADKAYLFLQGCELAVGNVSGEVVVYKGSDSKPWRKASDLGMVKFFLGITFVVCDHMQRFVGRKDCASCVADYLFGDRRCVQPRNRKWDVNRWAKDPKWNNFIGFVMVCWKLFLCFCQNYLITCSAEGWCNVFAVKPDSTIQVSERNTKTTGTISLLRIQTVRNTCQHQLATFSWTRVVSGTLAWQFTTVQGKSVSVPLMTSLWLWNATWFVGHTRSTWALWLRWSCQCHILLCLQEAGEEDALHRIMKPVHKQHLAANSKVVLIADISKQSKMKEKCDRCRNRSLYFDPCEKQKNTYRYLHFCRWWWQEWVGDRIFRPTRQILQVAGVHSGFADEQLVFRRQRRGQQCVVRRQICACGKLETRRTGKFGRSTFSEIHTQLKWPKKGERKRNDW